MAMDVVSKPSAYKEVQIPRTEVKVNDPAQTVQAAEPKTVKAETGQNGYNQENSQDFQNSQATQKLLENAIKEVNTKIGKGKTKCEISYHEPTKRISIKIIDKETDEVIREVPPEEELKMIEKLREIAGMLVDEKR